MELSSELVIERARRRLRREKRNGVLCLLLALGCVVLLVGPGRTMMTTGFGALNASYASLSPEARTPVAVEEHLTATIQAAVLAGIVIGGGVSICILLFALGIEFLAGNRERRVLVELADRLVK